MIKLIQEDGKFFKEYYKKYYKIAEPPILTYKLYRRSSCDKDGNNIDKDGNILMKKKRTKGLTHKYPTVRKSAVYLNRSCRSDKGKKHNYPKERKSEIGN